jgi:hypothetical protein
MAAAPSLLETHAPCPCGMWTFRDLVLATDMVANLRRCPRCRQKVLVVHKRAHFIVALTCRVASGGSVRMAIRAITKAQPARGPRVLSHSEIAALVEVVREVEAGRVPSIPEGPPPDETGGQVA